jgi:pimeloyl-ACP methyl ester carboxylesterase
MPFVTLPWNETLAAVGLREAPTLFYTVNDQRGAAAAPALLLLHGAGGSYLTWPPQLRHWPGAAVYAIDLPGHGQSPPLGLADSHPLSVTTYSTVVGALLENWSLERVVLAGHSMGAAVALTCALSPHVQPRLAGLVLLGAGATLPVNPRIIEGLQTDFTAMTARLITWMFGPSYPEKWRAQALAELQKNSPAQLIADFQACAAFDVRDELAQFRLPTLVICGAVDKMTPVAHNQQLAEAIEQSRLHVVPECGHMVMVEAPTAVTELIAKFIDTVAALPAI